MDIRYILPGPISKTSLGAGEAGQRLELLKSWAPPDADVTLSEVAVGPASIESSYEEHISVAGMARAVLDAEKDGADAVIIGCADDPGADALRELVTQTVVVGPGSASMHVAAQLGDRFGVITIPEVAPFRRFVHHLGLESRMAGVTAIDVPVLELRSNPELSRDLLVKEGRSLLAQGADSIVFGCMSMAFLGVDEALSDELGVPVVNPAMVALGTAATLVRARLFPSKLAYPLPPKVAAGKALDELLMV